MRTTIIVLTSVFLICVLVWILVSGPKSEADVSIKGVAQPAKSKPVSKSKPVAKPKPVAKLKCDVDVTIEGIVLPVSTWWWDSANTGEKGEFLGPRGKIPSGHMDITVDPILELWIQEIKGYQLNDEKIVKNEEGSDIFYEVPHQARFGFGITLKKGDRLRIILEKPDHQEGWGSLVEVEEGAFALVSISVSEASFDPKVFEEGTWKGKEEFQNLFFFIEKYGQKEMARRVAELFVKKRSEKDFQGCVEIDFLGLCVSQRDGALHPAFQKMKLEEVQSLVEKRLEKILPGHNWLGIARRLMHEHKLK